MANPKYLDFKKWLTETGKIEECAEAVEYTYSMNRFLQKQHRFSDTPYAFQDVFCLINSADFEALYAFRRTYYWDSSWARKDKAFQLLFEYYGKSYDSFRKYEIESMMRTYNPSTLFVCRGNIACVRYGHPIEDVAATIAVENGNIIKIHASRCRKCNLVFIQKEYYLQLRKAHKFMIADFCELSEDGHSIIPPGKFAAESPLMLCGYTVNQTDNLSDDERHYILANVIFNGILNKTEIINYLEGFLVFNASKDSLHLAKAKWENDLEFIRGLNLESHPVLSVSDIRPYSMHTK